MNSSPSTNLRQTALDCVTGMGDIFWDFDAVDDARCEYHDPRIVAADAVEDTLREVALDVLSNVRKDSSLRDEYETLISELPKEPTDDQVIGTLVANGEWTLNGARVVLDLAQTYGRSILREALALAEAMNIEDGSAGL